MGDSFFYRPGSEDLEGSSITEQHKEIFPKEQNVRMQEESTVSYLLPRGKDFLDLLSAHFLICNEKIPGSGEDSGFESYTSENGIIGVFDGCGGLGSKICTRLSGKTEAFLASRAVCNAVRMWFYREKEDDDGWNINLLKELIVSNLSICQKYSGNQSLTLKGTLVRPFPSTLAVVVFHMIKDELWSEHIWAGDSRTYIVDCNGIGQVSSDDIKGEDAMSNLTRDGALTNVVSVDEKFKLHRRSLKITKPCIVISASDGCFGYVTSPMEFEWMILSTLVKASNIDEWQRRLDQEIVSRAGDDQTIAIVAFGFEEFSELQAYYQSRYKYVSKIARAFNAADRENGQKIWEIYKKNYYRYAVNKVK